MNLLFFILPVVVAGSKGASVVVEPSHLWQTKELFIYVHIWVLGGGGGAICCARENSAAFNIERHVSVCSTSILLISFKIEAEQEISLLSTVLHLIRSTCERDRHLS